METSSPGPGASSSGGQVARPRRGEALKLGILFGSLALFQGINEPTEGLSAQPVRSLLGAWGRSASEVTAFSALVSLPWLLKPFFGLFSDFVPLAGSRRKSYLAATTLVAAVSLLTLALVPLSPRSGGWLLGWLIAATAGVAFADVASDALAVERGQALGLTGRFQAIQGGSTYAAGILVGLVGGELSARHLERSAFLLCGGVATVALLVVLVGVREPVRPARLAGPGEAVKLLARTVGSPAILGVGGFLFLWNFNPFSNALLQIHMTRGLGFGEQFFGRMLSLSSLASIVASLAYGTYCRRVPMPRLVHLSIALGVVSTLGYTMMSDERSAVLVTAAVGFTYMTATLIQLDLAARICPPEVAGTVFAILMALQNLAAALSVWLGGVLYEWGSARWGNQASFQVLVVIGSAITASCWLLLFALRFEHFGPRKHARGGEHDPVDGNPLA